VAAYPGKRNTLRRVHSAWSSFFEYATRVHGHFPVNPMIAVTRPSEEQSPIQFYELDEVRRIVDAQPTAERRALFALLYGTGIEVGTALRLTRADIWDASREIRAAGTKTHTRDRVAIVADWLGRSSRSTFAGCCQLPRYSRLNGNATTSPTGNVG
jgi:site-specific recombinase XerD